MYEASLRRAPFGVGTRTDPPEYGQGDPGAGLSKLNLGTMKAYHMRLILGTAWKAGAAPAARRVLTAWRRRVHAASRPGADGRPSLLEPMARVARTIKEHTRGILNYFRKRLTSGVIEGFNSFVQAARARARGYRNPETFKTMIYLLGERLKFNLPGLGEWACTSRYHTEQRGALRCPGPSDPTRCRPWVPRGWPSSG